MTLEIQNLEKLYKNGRGVKDINLTIASGEVLGLLGPNGSGKTTIMKACTGLLCADKGNITIGGWDIAQQREQAMYQTGALIEAPSLFENMTALHNMQLAASFYTDVNAARIDEVLRIVGLDRYKNDRTRTFSLGMRQRLGLALALLNRPRLLILDEPANGLDIEGMVSIRDIIKEAASQGAAVMVSSHLAHEIELCATKVGVMYEGELLNLLPISQALIVSPSLEDFFLSEVNKYRRRAIA